MTESDQRVNDANVGESEHAPEALLHRERDRSGRADNRRWRYAVHDLDTMDHTGPGVWEQIGPAPLLVGNQQVFQGIGPDSGEVVDIAIDPRSETRTMYAAAGNGGVWKTTDGGTSWRPMTDQLPATSIGAVAVDPVDPDVVYVGTGNLFNGAAGMAKAAGLFKSVDGGRSWSRLTSPAGRPPQPITAAANVAGGVRVTVAGHGYASLDRVVAVGLPGVIGARGEGPVRRIDANRLRIGGVTMTGGYGGAGATLYDARQAPFLSDRGVIRMVCPAGGALLVASETGLYYSADGGRSFGANHPAYDDGRPLRTGLISALEIDQGWTRTMRVQDATPTSPIRVTLPGHGFVSGDHVLLGGVTTNREANGTWTLDVVDADHITLRGSSGNGTGAVTGFAMGPTHPVTHPVTAATNPGAPNPVVLTCAAHGFVTGDVVAVSGVGGNTGANGSWQIRVRTPDTFELVGSRGTGAYTNGGVVDGPRHPAPRPITAAANAGAGITVTAAGHGLVEGDLVSVLGLPGVTAPRNSATAHVVDANTVRLAGLHLGPGAVPPGATLLGPADAYNTAYVAAAGRLLGGTTVNPDRGLFRLAITSTGEVVLSDNLLRHTGGPPGVFGRVAFTQSLLPRTRTLFVSVQDDTAAGGIFVGLFRSTNAGATWQVRPGLVPRVNVDGAGQTAYDLVVAVDPQDPTRVYAAQQQLWRSTDGGATWPTVNPATRGGVDRIAGFGRSPSTTLLHWDHHELVFAPPTWWDWAGADPVQPTPAYHGTDGGIARSGVDAAGAMTFTDLNEGIATSLLVSLDMGRGAGIAATFGGMQDTGTAGHRAGDAARTWVEGIDGDGGPVAVDPANPDIVFGTDNHSLIRTTNGGATWFMAGLVDPIPIQAVTATNPIGITTAGHSFRTGDTVRVTGVPGGGVANGVSTIDVTSPTIFTLRGKDGTGLALGQLPTVTGTRYLGRHDVVAATLTAPIEIETAQPHGCATDDKVVIEAVEGNLAANNTPARPTWQVTVISPKRLSLQGSDGSLSPPYVPGTGRMRGPGAAGSVPVFGTVNANPLVVTAQGHELASGDPVTIVGVVGNTAANVAGQAIRVLDANSFELVGVAGNANPGAMPRVRGRTIGRGLPVPDPNFDHFERIALVPNGANPAQTVYFSQDRRLFRSTNGGITFVPMASFTDFITALHAPDANRLWVGTTSIGGGHRFRVRFSADGGAHWAGAAQHFVSDIGARSFISQIVEDPAVAGGQRVAVVTAGYSGTATQRRSRHVFLTTTGGTTTGGAVPWHEVGGVFNAATGNLPDVPVMGATWVTHPAAPSDLLVATDAGVLQLDLATPSWKRVGPNLPKVGVQAIASDTSVNPSVVRIGTYGRSAWQLRVPTGPSLHVEADLGFGDQQVGTTVRRRLVLHSVGDAPVHVSDISGATGDVTVASVPPVVAPATDFPVTLAPGEHRPFDVVFTPSATGDRGAFLLVASDDPDHPAVEVKVTGFGVAAGTPRLAVRAFLEFGVVRSGSPGDLPLQIRNLGDAPLQITTLALDAHGSARFSLVAPPAVPFTVPPSGSVPVTVRFAPTANGTVRGGLVVAGGTQGQVVTLVGTGTTTAAGMVAVLFDLLGVGGPPEAVA